jgi:hypothetical protein
MVQPEGRRKFRDLSIAERVAAVINNAIDRGDLDQERVRVVAYNKSGEAIDRA